MESRACPSIYDTALPAVYDAASHILVKGMVRLIESEAANRRKVQSAPVVMLSS